MPQPDPTATDIVTVAEKIALSARELSGQIDHDRRLPDPLLASLNAAGLLRATMPLEVEALELAPGAALRCAEAIARGDASAGWCVSIAITSALLVAYLPESSREEMFGGGRGVAAGVWAPRGTAKSGDGGVVVSGRWPFCSGISHADMMFAGCFVDDQRVPSVVALPKADLKVLDTWHTLGLRGTGSHDSIADEVFVPADRVFSVFDGPALERPLYRFPVFGFFALSIGAAALGNARAAIDDLVELAAGKKGLGSTRTLAERPATQAAVATAEAALDAARTLYYQAIDAAWRASHDADAVPVALRNRLRLAATHAVRTSADVVRTMYDLAGGSAIYDSSPLQRRFRDAFTATAHFQVNEASRELSGRVLLDQPSDVSML
ncbi:acyl-CoA dehydrogenase, C-terminal domain protein [Mycobacterium kansasii 732]|uniref:Flavin-dependent monooxygenase, oxygenase subunit HsaA n=1 Tax=Mycobacterium pseudokansasii TaxID=2341080 RepID=A0A498QR30_9MYCO|nr:acyl-CoA dehydrogenase family protein [Mycobacterium pseudokansasii]EUA08568.1 acyl-CoA dehydrogenase, C-terminal domain protein [Mycobacterium kansasii 732]KZS70136.1 hydroxylase [Mycobacterium kansasii]MBY0387657.1 hydroxylase [Mycobacterium pseudokansasii]VAZ91670.1 Flavin-dependent monooxygenase, oxygenase subunit HsaA [Mycobacterium pseudokansasii]VAZ92634.1 Flavin-dependent monooxygenase, oxygenase subunit HsaA [Mycobacterium pseudokansasii]